MNLLLIIQYTLVSITMIVTSHYIWSFLKTNLTIPKTKDLVKKPTELYRDIYSTMNKTDSNEDMKKELKNYIGELKNNNNNNNTSTSKEEEISAGFQNDNFFNWNNDTQNNEDEEYTMDLSARIK